MNIRNKRGVVFAAVLVGMIWGAMVSILIKHGIDKHNTHITDGR